MMRFRAVLRPLSGRFLHSVLTLWLVTVLFFLVIEIMPGDFAIATATQQTTPEMIEATRHRLGLFASAPERYVRWLTGVLTGDLGTSWWARQPILPLIAERLWHSTWLFCWAAVVTIPLSLVLALAAAARPHSLFDRFSSSTALTVMSVPEFIVAYAVMGVLAVKFDLFPAYTMFALDIPWTERLYASTLPILSLVAVTVTPMFRLTRAALINVLETDYIEMAEIKGLSRWRILTRHAFPNALGPIANAIVLAMANLFFGLVIVEIIYSYPGLSKLLVTAVRLHDVPLVQACGLIAATLFITLNFIADMIGILANPRIRHPSTQGTERRIAGGWQGKMVGRMPRPALIGGSLAGLAVLGGIVIWTVNRGSERAIVTVPEPAGTTRDRLTVSELLGERAYLEAPIHYDYFKPFGTAGPAKHTLEGVLHFPALKARRRPAWSTAQSGEVQFPAFETRLVVHGDALLPVERGQLLKLDRFESYIALSAGRVWHEPGDGDWSRAAFPFTLTRFNDFAAHYGVATFLFNGKTVSQVRLQIAQETGNWVQFDAWGQAEAVFDPGKVAAAHLVRAAHDRQEALNLDIRPWSELAVQYWRSLEAFDGKGNRHNISVSGLMIDDVFYLRPCRTRAGPHPFCRQMRHGVFSITKSMGAGVAMLWLAQKYGPQVFDEKIGDYVKIPAGHDGWKNVTFGHTLDMVTGIGNVVPQRVDYYVEADGTAIGNWVWRAATRAQKVSAIARFQNYPWGPGEVFRYRSADTTVLSAAMHSFLQAKEGPDADLWDRLTEEVFKPLGIEHLPIRRTREPDGRRGMVLLAGGLYPTIEETLKIARLLQNHGAFDGRQLLHRELTERAVSNAMDRGYPNGWRTRGGEGRYEMSFWLTPHPSWFSCDVRIPTMSGFGGNYVSIMPNGTIGLRFADGHDDDRYTWDSSGIRNISDRIRPFCG